jgi:hypothetical protein
MEVLYKRKNYVLILSKMETLSVTEYAKRLGVTRSAVLLQIKEKRLAKGVTCKKIGNTYSLSVRGQKTNKK